MSGTVHGPNVQVGGNVSGDITIMASPEGSWPVHEGVVPREAACYQVRNPTREVELALVGGATAMVPGVTMLVGTGGVGKTQIAAHYAREASRDASVDLVVWVNATSREVIITTFAHVAERLLVVPADTCPEHSASRLLTWLSSTDYRWLIVFDDLRDPADLRGLWPTPSELGQVMLTTRRRESALTGTDVRVVEVGVFTPEESAVYLNAKLTNYSQLIDGVAELAAELGYLPLALAQAVAYLIDRNITCSAYVARFRDRRKELGDLFPDESGLPDDHGVTVAVTWTLSAGLANALQPRGLARPLLEIASLLDPSGVPSVVFTSPSILDYLADSVGRTVDADDAADALRCLYRLSLITLEPDGAVAVHRLVQRATRDALTIDRVRTLAHVVADALVQAWPDVERDTTLAASLRANTSTLADHAEAHLWHPQCHPVLSHAGESLGESGLIRQAVDHYRYLRTIAVDQLGDDHPDTLGIRNNLATWRAESGEIAGAIEEFERLLADQIRIGGPDQPLALSIRNNLAVWRGSAGDIAGAIVDFERLLVDQNRLLGPDDNRSLITRSNIASLRGEAGDVLTAVDELEHLLADRLRVLGPDHPDTLATRDKLAHWREAAGDAAGAVDEFEHLLADQVQMLGVDHPNTFTTRNNLAAARGYAGDVRGAITEFEQLLDALLRVMGADNPHTLTTRSNLVFWRGQAGDSHQAVEELKGVLNDRLRVLGPDHPDTLHSRSDLAHLQRDAGDIRGAIKELEHLLADRLRVLGPDHPDTFNTRNSLAGFRGESGDTAGAIDELERLLTDQAHVLSFDHPDILATRNNLAGLRGQTGDVAGAIRELENLLKSQLRVSGPDHPKTLSIRHNLAGFRGESGNAIEAIDEFEKLVADMRRVLGSRHPDTLAARGQLANLRGHAGDSLRAIIELDSVLKTSMQELGPEHAVTVTAAENVKYWRMVAFYA